MISAHDFYNVMSAMVPLYVAMILAYASVRWLRIFTPDQCSGISRFVSFFAVPLLSFHSIAGNNPYKMNLRFLAADTLQKLIILAALGLWALLAHGSLGKLITIFSIATLPNTLVVGIPLLGAMYGDYSGDLMVQIVVLQSIIWYTLLLFLFELRASRILIKERFPETGPSIASFDVAPDVVSLGSSDLLETDVSVGANGKFHVTLRRSNARSTMSGVEIFSCDSLRNQTSTGSNFKNLEISSVVGHGRILPFAGQQSSIVPVDLISHPSSRFEENPAANVVGVRSTRAGLYREFSGSRGGGHPAPTPEFFGLSGSRGDMMFGSGKSSSCGIRDNGQTEGKVDLHMFEWSSRESEGGRVHATDGADVHSGEPPFSGGGAEASAKQMPPPCVMIRLILTMVWRKLIRNPNTWAWVIGLVWTLVSCRWNVKMPKLVAKSISILSDAGLGMAMFSLGLFMGLQPRLIACGASVAALSMIVRFVVGPAVAAASALALGIRGNLLRISIVQAALPQGIVPFVFANEYNVHPTVLSTVVIFGLLLALPIDIIYYILLGL